MNVKLLQATDVVGGSFSLMLAVCLVSSIMLLLGTSWVSKKWKIPVCLSALVTLVASLYYYDARILWQEFHQIPTIYHYLEWFVTMPLQVLSIFFFVVAIAPLSYGLFWRLLIASIIMVLVRYMGEVGYMYSTLGFLCGIVAWLYILGEFYFGHMSDIVDRQGDEVIQRGYFWLRLIVTVGWAVYPLSNFIIVYAGGGANQYSLNMVLNMVDLINQIVFVMIVLQTAIMKSIITK